MTLFDKNLILESEQRTFFPQIFSVDVAFDSLVRVIKLILFLVEFRLFFSEMADVP